MVLDDTYGTPVKSLTMSIAKTDKVFMSHTSLQILSIEESHQFTSHAEGVQHQHEVHALLRQGVPVHYLGEVGRDVLGPQRND